MGHWFISPSERHEEVPLAGDLEMTCGQLPVASREMTPK
jgi:hypothetical protein